MSVLNWIRNQSRIYGAIRNSNSDIESYAFETRAIFDSFPLTTEQITRKDEISNRVKDLRNRIGKLVQMSPLGSLYNYMTEMNMCEFDRY